MKTSLRILLFVSSYSLFYYQSIAQSIDCANQAYPYKFCSPASGGGYRLVSVCTKNPHTVYSNNHHYKPFRRPYPSCFKIYSTLVFTINNVPVNLEIIDNNGTSKVVFDLEQQKIDVETAFNKWNGLCPNGYDQGEPKCCVKIDVITDDDEWLSLPRDPDKIAATLMRFDINNECQDPCSGDRFIHWNATNQWLYRTRNPKSTDPIKRMFYTGNTAPSFVRTDLALYSLVEILTHEFGHWYGLDELDGKTSAESYPNDLVNCHTPLPAVMNSTHPPNQNPRDLTEYDKCYFKKLYCPDIVPELNVHDLFVNDAANIYRNFPNPLSAENNFTTTIPFELKNSGDVQLKIFNLNGEVVYFERKDELRIGYHHFNLDAHSFNSGYYFCQVNYIQENENKTIGYLVVQIIK